MIKYFWGVSIFLNVVKFVCLFLLCFNFIQNHRGLMMILFRKTLLTCRCLWSVKLTFLSYWVPHSDSPFTHLYSWYHLVTSVIWLKNGSLVVVKDRLKVFMIPRHWLLTQGKREETCPSRYRQLVTDNGNIRPERSPYIERKNQAFSSLHFFDINFSIGTPKSGFLWSTVDPY